MYTVVAITVIICFNSMWLRDLSFSLICQYKNLERYSILTSTLPAFHLETRFHTTAEETLPHSSLPSMWQNSDIKKKKTHFWHSKRFTCSTVGSNNTLVSRFTFFLSCVRIPMGKWKLYYSTYYLNIPL